MSTFNPNAYLNKVLNSYALTHIKPEIEELHKWRQEVVNFLRAEFPRSAEMASDPVNSGSMKKNTAINIGLDLDIVVPFKHLSFTGEGMNGHLKNMAESVTKALQARFQNQSCGFRSQRVSSGLKFPFNGSELAIDVVPGMETAPGSYREGKDHGLFLWDRLAIKEKAVIKTDIHKQVQKIKGPEYDRERKIVCLLKVFKKTQQVKVPSILLELITIRAFEAYKENHGQKYPKGLANGLLVSLDYIAQNIAQIKLKDPGYSKNDIAGSLPPKQRKQLAGRFRNMVNTLEQNPEKWATFFPANNKYARN